jgi:glycosyltransferase involved in cell wall biosynthesis
MHVLFDNINFTSNSGPNSFGTKLAIEFSKMDVTIHDSFRSECDVQLSFIERTRDNNIPKVLRLDGIYFNTAQNWEIQNSKILDSYKSSDAVIVQSNFNKVLVEKYFGIHDNINVINNGTDVNEYRLVVPTDAPSLQQYNKVWLSASSWRPHKRLNENILYFLEHSKQDECMVVAGKNANFEISDPRVFYAGECNRQQLLSLYKAADYFIHLAYLDHCPNVVVDARAADCHIICSSSGGTKEISGENSTIIIEDEWNLEPCDLYNPPKMDFSKKKQGTNMTDICIKNVSKKYADVLRGVIR